MHQDGPGRIGVESGTLTETPPTAVNPSGPMSPPRERVITTSGPTTVAAVADPRLLKKGPDLPRDRIIAYFSMEIGHCAEIPTYTGGLGVLAGDTIRAAADLGVPMVAITLLHRRGYFHQLLDDTGNQREEPVNWVVHDFLEETPARASVILDGRTVHIRAWQYHVAGEGGFKVPVYFLDTSLQVNSEWDRTLTDYLYGGDSHYRLCQEVILGIGGVRILRALGYHHLQHFHVNEGHASLLTLELLEERLRTDGRQETNQDDVDAVRRTCVFTTHTPVPAGHDRFPAEMVRRVLGDRRVDVLTRLGCLDGTLNMTHLGLRLSGFVNGVSVRHGEVSRQLLNEPNIHAITNGVHAGTWVSPPFRELFDRHLPGWRRDSYTLRRALQIPTQEIWSAHAHAKRRLLEYVNRETNAGMVADAFTIGFARRAASYKRADLLLDDLDRLKRMHRECGPIQIIYAGKAHPHDQGAKELIRRVYQAKANLKNEIKLSYLVDYDIDIGALMTAGVDLWLNTPEPPLEASGTSGMKAAMNGVPSLSVLDGWWIEGCLENVTGWSIGRDDPLSGPLTDRIETARITYDKLEYVVLPMFYAERERFIGVMRNAIAINGPFFSTQRMLEQYVVQAYFR